MLLPLPFLASGWENQMHKSVINVFLGGNVMYAVVAFIVASES